MVETKVAIGVNAELYEGIGPTHASDGGQRPKIQFMGVAPATENECALDSCLGRKVGNKLIVEGEELHGHQDHSIEPPGSGSDQDAD